MLQALVRPVFATFAVLFATLTMARSASAQVPPVLSSTPFPAIAINELIVMPDMKGHEAFIAGINGAKTSIDMAMFHLTDQDVINALINKAHSSPVHIRIIVDGKSAQGASGQAMFASLKGAGIDIRPSSPMFSIMHEKSMIIDNQYAFITSINLTNTAQTSRDYGIVTNDVGIISEMETVFNTDLDNSVKGTGFTPNVQNRSLVWSPVSSEPKLIELINFSHKTLLLTVESITDNNIIAAIAAAAARGVQVYLMVPECNDGDSMLDYPAVHTLQASHVNVRMTPEPRSFEVPYMHAKSIIADGALVYVGSVNYSWNSTSKARELGVIFFNQTVAAKITADFQTDWSHGVAPAANPTAALCAGVGYNAPTGSSNTQPQTH